MRLNMSHGDHVWHARVISDIRKLQKQGYALAIMVDITGPQVRTGDLKIPLKVRKGDILRISTRGLSDHDHKMISVNYDHFATSVKLGSTIVMDNGLLKLRVIGKTADSVRCQCLGNFTIGSRRHINLPGVSLKLPFLTKKDWDDLKFGITQDVDFFALSFVRRAKDILQVRKFLEKKRFSASLIAKIESHESIKVLPEIVEVSDAVMVARGDLGAEVPFSEVPILQRDIIDLCNLKSKPVIVATHILESMTEHPTPTRAEVSDLANAVFQGADAVMLSGETANGAYPLEALEAMTSVIDRTEEDVLRNHSALLHHDNVLKEELAESAAVMAANLHAKGIVVFTHSGYLATLSSRSRPVVPVFAFSRTPKVDRKLLLAWGVKPFFFQAPEDSESRISKAFHILQKAKYLRKGDQVILLSDILSGADKRVHTVQVRTI